MLIFLVNSDRLSFGRGIRASVFYTEPRDLTCQLILPGWQVFANYAWISLVPITANAQGCLKVNSGAVFGELNASQREHSFDVVGQRAQSTAN